ncbi:bacteriohemerythrin [Candidatus Sulfurimonas baltica]|uniref:Hemerythrin domain-containing protein n=1 Tax=Candidatus Sulfurimonas baltica TaxID=2740404 RepID=A0A7S7LVE8_9BACT|nr:hemerythrin domain-containing protein [Candidatus Sulfurimonas baltica]QOY52171.1 hemerythrin domain-containing protein [Candidatus Sulfurimonas baltica]
MESFHWDKYYLTDMKMIDEQHKKLVDIINEYGSLLSDDKLNTVSLERVFKELFDYTLYHFDEEEQLMRTMNVDERHISSHIKNHRYFLDEITRMHESLLTDSLAYQMSY